MNPFMQFIDGGRRFQCVFCGAATDGMLQIYSSNTTIYLWQICFYSELLALLFYSSFVLFYQELYFILKIESQIIICVTSEILNVNVLNIFLLNDFFAYYFGGLRMSRSFSLSFLKQKI